MNTQNTISSAQIVKTFQAHNLATQPSIRRITSGFTNEVYEVDHYILKVCVKAENESNFEREAFLYRALRSLARIPDPIVIDTSRVAMSKYYMIYPRIKGDSAGRRWHLLSNRQRRGFIQDLCQQLKAIDAYPIANYVQRFALNPCPIWKQMVQDRLNLAVEAIRERAILSEAAHQAIDEYIRTNAFALEEQQLGLVFWDVQFDNMLIDPQNRLAGLIDFEGISVASIDYRLMLVRTIAERPHLFMSEDMEPFANPEDYGHLMEWYREFYPEQFRFPYLDTRLDLYELGDILDHLPAWPKTKQLHDRLARILDR